MKKLRRDLFMAGIALLLFSCGGNKKQEANTTAAPKSMVAESQEAKAESGKEAKIAAGKVVYQKVCQACHQADGKGIGNTFPPLAQSDYLKADLKRAIAGVVNGLSGEITVNGTKYNQNMPATTLSDEEVAAAFTYVVNSFGNDGGEVNAADVAAVRK